MSSEIKQTEIQGQFGFIELLWPLASLLVIAFLPCFPTGLIPNIITRTELMPEPMSWFHAHYLGFPWPLVLMFPISAFLFMEIQPRTQFFTIRYSPIHLNIFSSLLSELHFCLWLIGLYLLYLLPPARTFLLQICFGIATTAEPL